MGAVGVRTDPVPLRDVVRALLRTYLKYAAHSLQPGLVWGETLRRHRHRAGGHCRFCEVLQTDAFTKHV